MSDRHPETTPDKPWEIVHWARVHPASAAAEIIRLRSELDAARADIAMLIAKETEACNVK